MPLVDGFDDTSIHSIGHLGIVASAYDSLQITDMIDAAIPKTRQHHFSHSQVVKAMVLNGLGFVERRLYLYPAFFSDIAIERLLGEGVTTEHLNDDVPGRTLDAIALFGPTELFNEIVVECLLASDYGTHCLQSIPPLSASAETMTPTSIPVISPSPTAVQRTAVRTSSSLFSGWRPISMAFPSSCRLSPGTSRIRKL